jgi:succinyl-CoA synthetase alpha subunit
LTKIFDILKGKPEDSDFKKKGVIVQGITGAYGSIHAKHMMAYGTNVVAGVGGQKFEDKVPIYNSVKEAVDATGANISIIYTPAKFFLSAAKDALDAGIKLLVAIPEHVPIRDTLEAIEIAKKTDAIIIGPNTPGVLIPDLIKVGIMPPMPFKEGKIAVLSKSGTLLYEISDALSQAGFGQSITIGVGGDPVNGTKSVETLRKC